MTFVEFLLIHRGGLIGAVAWAVVVAAAWHLFTLNRKD